MAPVATSEKAPAQDPVQEIKAQKVFNPFYSPPGDDDGNVDYKYADFKPSFPNITYEPLKEQPVVDRGTFADPNKASLFGAATTVKHLTPVIGTEIEGIDLRQLTDAQKDELALLVAERGVVFFRDQEINIHEQLELARHFGPLHKHATTPIPRIGLEEVHGSLIANIMCPTRPKLGSKLAQSWATVKPPNDASRRPDPTAFSKLELWHTDVSYELQPPSTTSLKVITGPEVGGDTLWSSGYALYSSLSPGFQSYLEGLTAVHSGVAQADGNRAAGLPVQRQEIESIHPVVRVHPVTGWKSIYVNPGFTRRIIGVPKAESDFILNFLFRQIGENPDFQVRFKWEVNSIALWDNRVVTHSATFDFWPATRHALRATPHGERPTSVEDYERQTGKEAKDRQLEIWKQQGVKVELNQKPKTAKTRGYND